MNQPDTASIAVISSYVPRRCGIATFSFDLSSAISKTIYRLPIGQNDRVSVVALTDSENEYDYGNEVLGHIRQHHRDDYHAAAEMLNTSKVDAVSLQHEYGLFGGNDGAYILELLERLRKPVITTLHTVLAEPTDGRRNILNRIAERSSTVIVMAERAARILNDAYEVPSHKIRLIHHGVPDVPFGETETFKERFGLSGRPMILTFGLLNPGKGIETMLEAVARIVADHPKLAYVVLGVTHPNVKRESGESYRISLERQAVKLGIQKNVEFHNRYVSLDDLCEYLRACDIYTTPYLNRDQIVSGTLAYALACGNAIISTPYWYAQELLADGRGRLVEFHDVDGFAANLNELLTDDDQRHTLQKQAYDYARRMTWPQVAREYADAFDNARQDYDRAKPKPSLPAEGRLRMSLPEVRLDHLHIMTDDTGMLQHSIYATPDRHHGYTTDDNARALIVAGMMSSLFHDEQVLPRLHVYLSFLHHAFNPSVGRFRNFMSYDRTWLEDDGSDDCQGRVIWALGHLISHSPNTPTRRHAADLFLKGVGSLDSVRFPRSRALGILGLHYYLRVFPDDAKIRDRLEALSRSLNDTFEKYESAEWPWCEELVTYDNGRLPQALIIAGLTLGEDRAVARGLRALKWLLGIQTAEAGHLSAIGNDGWYHRSGQRAVFDQQPLEAAALIGACKAAYRASGEARWLGEMRRCFEWYLGRNDTGLALIDFKTRGCYDGLQADGVNQNQGAESLLSWLLSLLIMYEMQTGEVVEAA